MSKRRKNVRGNSIILEDDVDISKAIKRFRRLVKQNGILVDYNKHKFYTKPSQTRKHKQSDRKCKIKIWHQNKERDEKISNNT